MTRITTLLSRIAGRAALRRERLRVRLYACFAHDLRQRVVAASREARRLSGG